MNELLKREIAKFLIEELEIPREMIITVTNVIVSSDLKSAKIFVSVYPVSVRGQALEFLNKNLSRLNNYLASNLVLRVVPRIRYLIDVGGEEVEEIDEILKKIKEED